MFLPFTILNNDQKSKNKKKRMKISCSTWICGNIFKNLQKNIRYYLTYVKKKGENFEKNGLEKKTG